MTTTTPALIPVAEYLAASYDPDREYIDGSIEERNLGEYDHARLQGILVMWFGKKEGEWKIRVVPELRVQVSPTRFRIPDVTVLDRARPVEQIITHPPLIVIEVLSPEDTWRRVMERVQDYLDFGVRYIWILDPGTRRAWTTTRHGLEETRILEAAGPASPISIPLDELFREEE